MRSIWLICLLTARLSAQGFSQTSYSTDGTTHPGVAPGSPSGAYALSGFDRINLFNGKLNFALPLLTVGGRGETNYTVTLNLDQAWRVRIYADCTIQAPCLYYHTPIPDWWSGAEVGYGPGMVVGRFMDDSIVCPGNQVLSNRTLTRLSFIEADGTEHDLRDVNTDGAPFLATQLSSGSCVHHTVPARGPVFASYGGEAMTFVATAAIPEAARLIPTNESTRPTIFPSGTLYFADGRKYEVTSGKVMKIRDRNGNTVYFEYNEPNGRVTKITEPSREITFSYAFPSGGACDIQEGSQTLPCDKITYATGTNTRIIRVYWAPLALTGVQTQTNMQLFQGAALNLDPYASPVTFNPPVARKVRLANGSHYRFSYNAYGEVTEVVLPTGGKVQYTIGTLAWGPERPAILRRILERREYDESSRIRLKTEYCYTCTGSVTVTDLTSVSPNYSTANIPIRKAVHVFDGMVTEDSGAS